MKQLILSGGIGYLNKDHKTPEAVKMQSFFIQNGVSSKDILIEYKSKSSFENIRNSLELIKNRCQLEKAKIALITSDFHLRRCTEMTRLATENKPDLFGYGAKDGITDQDNWVNTKSSRMTIYKEALNLPFYVRRGSMCDTEIEGLTLERMRSK